MSLAATPAVAAPGSLDTSFGTGGVVGSAFGTHAPPSSFGSGVVAGPDGRIYVAGTTEDASGNEELFVARYTAQGALDPSFGTGGVTVEQLGSGTSPTTGNQLLTRLALEPNGSVVVATSSSYEPSTITYTEVVVARFTSSGKLDPTFASGGVLHEQLSSSSSSPQSGAYGVAVQPNGDIVLTGFERNSAGNDEFFAQRLLGSNGSPDPSFGTGGLVEQQLGLGTSPSSIGTDVLVQPDGKLAFSAQGTDPSGQPEVVVTRLTSAGATDPGFGVGRVQASSDPTQPISVPLDVRMQSNGDLLIGGVAYDASGHQEYALTRFTSAGALDTSFGPSGTGVFLDQLAPTGGSSLGIGLAVQGNDRIVMTGTVIGPSVEEAGLIRLRPNGTLDPSFGSSGVVIQKLAQGTSPQTVATGGTITPDGQLVETGAITTTTAGQFDSLLAKVQLDAPPTVSFSYAPASPHARQRMTFRATASDDNSVAKIRWDFGSGTFTGTGATVVRKFARAGTYTIRVEAIDDDGLTTITSRKIRVGKPLPRLIVRKLKATTGGVIVKLACKGTGTCHGRAQLSTLEKLLGRKVVALSASGKAHHQRVVVGKLNRFSLRAGHSKTFTVKLNARGRKLLATFKRLPVTLTISLLNARPATKTNRRITIT